MVTSLYPINCRSIYTCISLNGNKHNILIFSELFNVQDFSSDDYGSILGEFEHMEIQEHIRITFYYVPALLKATLDNYKEGAKAKHLGVVCKVKFLCSLTMMADPCISLLSFTLSFLCCCKGGPGYMYLLKGKPVTPAKLIKDKDLIK